MEVEDANIEYVQMTKQKFVFDSFQTRESSIF